MKKSEQLLQNEQKITESVEISLRSENHILSTNVFYLKETNGLNFFKNFSDKIFNKLNGKPI